MFFENSYKSTWFLDSNNNFDIISNLPVEITSKIFSYVKFKVIYVKIFLLKIINYCNRNYLLPEDLIVASKVCKRWTIYCPRDKVLRKKIKSYKRKKVNIIGSSRLYKYIQNSGKHILKNI